MSKLPSLASAILYREVQGSGTVQKKVPVLWMSDIIKRNERKNES